MSFLIFAVCEKAKCVSVKFKNIFLLFIGIASLSFHTSIAQYDDNIVVAQEWEGIYEILLRNEFNPTTYRKLFIEIKYKENPTTLLSLVGHEFAGKC